jgi:hypothetical protein
MGYNLSTEKLLLHTIQPQEVFDESVSTGVLCRIPPGLSPCTPTPTPSCTGKWVHD